jgi:transposase
MKTVEFKLDLNQHQQATIDSWLDTLTWVWNNGLALLKWHEYWLRMNSFRFYPKLKPKDDDVEIPASTLNSWGFTDWDHIGLAPLRYHLHKQEVKENRGKTKEVKVWGIACDRTKVEKVSINDYPSFKTKTYVKEVVGEDIIYSQLPELEQGQFIEERKTKKGICHYLHIAGYREQKSHWRNEPPIKSDHKYAVIGYFSQKNIKIAPCIPEEIKERFGEVFNEFVEGECEVLSASWSAYKSGKKGVPRFKNRRREQVKTLINNKAAIREKQTDEDKERELLAKSAAKAGGEKYKSTKTKLVGSKLNIRDNRVKIPKIGYVRAKGLAKRWGDKHAINYKITKEPSGYYLQITGYFPPTSKVSLNREDGNLKAVGIDAGVTCLFADDSGRIVAARNNHKKEARRIARLQRQAARRKDGFKNWCKTQNKIAKIHEKSRRSGIASDHKLITKLVREYDGIACEDLNLKGMTAAPKTKLSEDGTTYAKVRRKQKAGLNKGLLRHTHGRRVAMLKTKVEAINSYHRVIVRELTKVAPHHTSQECSVCGFIDAENRKTQSVFLCLQCGHSDHADINASQNILKRGLTDFVRSYRSWEREVKPVRAEMHVSTGDVPVGESEIHSNSMRQEAATPAPSVEICASITHHPRKTERQKRLVQSPFITQLELDLWGLHLQKPLEG